MGRRDHADGSLRVWDKRFFVIIVTSLRQRLHGRVLTSRRSVNMP